MIDGIVITFVDIDRLKRAEQVALAARAFAEDVIESMRQGVLLLGEDLKVVSANRAFCEMFRTDRTRAVGMPVDRLFEAGAGLSEIGSQLREVLADHVDTDGTQIEAEIPRSGGVRKLLFSIRRMKPDADGLAHMILSIEPTPSA